MDLNKISFFAYYKLFIQNTREDSCHIEYAKYKTTTIGRDNKRTIINNNKIEKNHFSINDKKISKIHLKIFYDENKRSYCINCLSKNGLYVNGEYLSHVCSPVELTSLSLIQISNTFIYFLLPTKKRNFEKIDFEFFKYLGHIKDPLSHLPWPTHLTKINSLISPNIQTLPIFKNEKELNTLKISDLQTFIEILRRRGFFMWSKIKSDFMTACNMMLKDSVLFLLSMLIANELCFMAFLNGDFEKCKKLSLIVRKNSKFASVNYNDSLLLNIRKIIEGNNQLLDDFIKMYYLNTFVKLKSSSFTEQVEVDELDFKEWDLNCDIDLLMSVHKNGLDNFDIILKDQNNLFCKKLNTKWNKDSVTKKKHKFLEERFNNLINNLEIKFSNLKTVPKELYLNFESDFNRNYKNKWTVKEHFELLKILVNYGHIEDWNSIDLDLLDALLKNKTKSEIEVRYKNILKVIDTLLKEKKDSENEFNLTFNGAKNLKIRLDKFSELRKRLKSLKKEEISKKLSNISLISKEYVPSWWESPRHDIELLKGCLKHGIANSEKIKNDSNFNFRAFPQNSLKGFIIFCPKRFSLIAKAILNDNEITPIENYKINNSLKRKVPEMFNTKFKISFPLKINPELVVINLGKIDFEKVSLNSDSLMYNVPIGFKSVREDAWFVNPLKKCRYFCEIIDGPNKPIYSVTCEHSLSNPIRSFNPTVIWKIIKNKTILNDGGSVLQNLQVDGYERFGLKEPIITALISQKNLQRKKLKKKKVPTATLR